VDSTRISPAGDPFYAASLGYRRTVQDQDDQPHCCIAGVVYIGHLLEGEEGEDVEVITAVPCRRCADSR
jgi:hypothetical protein